MKKKFLLGTLVIVLLGGVYTAYQVLFHQPFEQKPFGGRPGGPDTPGGPGNKTQTEYHFSGKAAPPPKDEVSIYKGFWSPTLIYPRTDSPMKDSKKLKELETNLLSISPQFRINKEGQIEYPWDFPNINSLDQRIAEMTSIYHPIGIRLHLVLSTNYVEDFNEPYGGEPKPFPRELLSKPGFFDEYNKVVEEMAKIAQKYQLEMFSPMNEPDRNLGVEAAAKWNEQILPLVKKYYSGKLCYKGDIHRGEGDILSFKGYDVLGFMPSPETNDSGAEFRRLMQGIIANALKWAKRDEISKVMVAEFGAWQGEGLSQTDALARYRILFEEGQGKVQGFVVIDPPPDQPNFLKDEVFSEIKTWFTQRLDN